MMTCEDRQARTRPRGSGSSDRREGRAAAHGSLRGGRDLERALPGCVRATRLAVEAGDITLTVELADRGVRFGASGSDLGQLLCQKATQRRCTVCPTWRCSGRTLDLLPLHSDPWWLALSLMILEPRRAVSPAGRRLRQAGHPRASARTSRFRVPRDCSAGWADSCCLVRGGDAGILDLLPKPRARGRQRARVSSVSRGGALRAGGGEPSPRRVAARVCFSRRASTRRRFGSVGAVYAELMALNYFSVAAMHLGRYQDAADSCSRALVLGQRGSFE